jgi:hypothetical protein
MRSLHPTQGGERDVYLCGCQGIYLYYTIFGYPTNAFLDEIYFACIIVSARLLVGGNRKAVEMGGIGGRNWGEMRRKWACWKAFFDGGLFCERAACPVAASCLAMKRGYSHWLKICHHA